MSFVRTTYLSVAAALSAGIAALLASPALVTYSSVPTATTTSLVAPAEQPAIPTMTELGVQAELRYHEVPFYSQFYDISDPAWQKVGCGIASVAMLIGYYAEEPLSVDTLLAQGIAAGAFLPAAGWTHAGLIDLARPFGLTGSSQSLAHLTPDAALTALRSVVAEAPVMASVHYTFEPTNPIPHLVVVTGIDETTVYYNDPAEPTGEGSIPITKFQRAWKQRYISVEPHVS